MKCSPSTLSIRLLQINFEQIPSQYFSIRFFLKNRKNKNNWLSSRKNTIMNWESFHQDSFKIKFLLSPLNSNILQIILRTNYKLIFIHLIKSLNNQNNNWLLKKMTATNFTLTLTNITMKWNPRMNKLPLFLINLMINLIRESKNRNSPYHSKLKSFHPNRVKSFKRKWLLSPLNIHLLKITLRSNPKTIFIHIIKAFNNQKKNLYSSRKNIWFIQKSSHQNTFKIKWSLSILKLYLLNNALRLKLRPSLINLIKFLNYQKNNWWISYWRRREGGQRI